MHATQIRASADGSTQSVDPVENSISRHSALSPVIHVAIECPSTGDKGVHTRNLVDSLGPSFVDATFVDTTTTSEGRRVIAATFRRVCDATHAVTDLVHRHTDHPTHGQRGAGVRVGLCVGAADDRAAPCDPSARRRAAQLLSHAGAYQVVTTSATAAVAGPTLPSGTELVDRGVVDLGAERPERIYELRVHRDRADGMAGGASNLDWARRVADLHSPIPDDRVAELIEAWKSALDGGHTVVQLVSPDGFLATAAAAELALRVHADGAMVLRGSWDRYAPRPYGALREALGVYAAECSPALMRADLGTRVRDAARLLPELGNRLGRVPSWVPEQYNECCRVSDASSDWLTAIAARDDLLLVLDNVQWADAESLVLCEQLSNDLTDHRVLLVLCGAERDMRERGVHEAVTALARDAGGREVRIRLGSP